MRRRTLRYGYAADQPHLCADMGRARRRALGRVLARSDLRCAVQHPNVLFLAEAYWDLEWELQQLGFDYCYDKRLYDRLVHGNAESIREHLSAGLDYQDKLVRFIENHDELRAAATFSPEKERAAAVTIMTLPGAKLLYEGQFEGRRVRLPVFLARRPVEPMDAELQAFYHHLLAAVKVAGLRAGQSHLERRAERLSVHGTSCSAGK